MLVDISSGSGNTVDPGDSGDTRRVMGVFVRPLSGVSTGVGACKLFIATALFCVCITEDEYMGTKLLFTFRRTETGWALLMHECCCVVIMSTTTNLMRR